MNYDRLLIFIIYIIWAASQWGNYTMNEWALFTLLWFIGDGIWKLTEEKADGGDPP